MSVISFENKSALKYGLTDIKAAYQGGVKIWPGVKKMITPTDPWEAWGGGALHYYDFKVGEEIFNKYVPGLWPAGTLVKVFVAVGDSTDPHNNNNLPMHGQPTDPWPPATYIEAGPGAASKDIVFDDANNNYQNSFVFDVNSPWSIKFVKAFPPGKPYFVCFDATKDPFGWNSGTWTMLGSIWIMGRIFPADYNRTERIPDFGTP